MPNTGNIFEQARQEVKEEVMALKDGIRKELGYGSKKQTRDRILNRLEKRISLEATKPWYEEEK